MTTALINLANTRSIKAAVIQHSQVYHKLGSSLRTVSKQFEGGAKMKRCLALSVYLVILCFSRSAKGQQSEPSKLFPIIEGNKIGYIDKTGSVIIKPQFDVVSIDGQYLPTINFSEGLAGIKAGDKWGFINQSGEIAIKPRFRAVWFFSEGLAQVWIGNKSGYIDKTGRFVISPQFTGYSPFSEGLAGVNAGSDRKPEWGYIDQSGKFVIQPKFNSGGKFSEGLAWVNGIKSSGFIDRKGNFIIKLPIGLISEKFSEGLAKVWTTPDGRIGFIDKAGKIVINPRRWIPSDFSEGLAVVCYIKSPGMNCGYIDKEGRAIIEPQYALAGPFSEGLAPVCIALSPIPKMECGYIDKTGRLVIPMQFRIAFGFRDGLALVGIGDVYPDKWGYINRAGDYIWRPTN